MQSPNARSKAPSSSLCGSATSPPSALGTRHRSSSTPKRSLPTRTASSMFRRGPTGPCMAWSLLQASRSTWKSLGEGNLELRYVRDKEKREVDFIVLEQQKPICLVEAKFNDENLSGSLLYYQEKLKVPYAIQL